MTKLEEIIKEEERKLNEIYLRANTKSKRKKIVRDLLSFKQICNEHFNIDKKFIWEDDDEILKLLTNYRLPFVENIIDNSETDNEIFKNTLALFIEENYNSYKYYEHKYQRLTDYEEQEIILEFLNTYDPKLAKAFEEKLINAELFYANLDNYKGLTYSLGSINKNLMFYMPLINESIDCTATIVHEFGHSFEMNLFYSVGHKNYLDIAYQKPYFEIVSRFFEYAFLNYLKENRILLEDANKRIHHSLFDLLSRAFNINLIYQMEEINIDECDNIFLDEDNLEKYASEVQDVLNYHMFPSSKGDIIKFRDSFIYGIGDLLSIYLYESYKEDPINFKKELKTALLTYPYRDDLSSFETLGITEEKLINGKELKRILKDSK